MHVTQSITGNGITWLTREVVLMLKKYFKSGFVLVVNLLVLTTLLMFLQSGLVGSTIGLLLKKRKHSIITIKWPKKIKAYCTENVT